MKTLVSSAHNHALRVLARPIEWPADAVCAVCKSPAEGYVLMRGAKEVVYFCGFLDHAQVVHETAHGKTFFTKDEHRAEKLA